MKALFYIQYRCLVNQLKETLKSPKSWIPALLILIAVAGFVTMMISMAFLIDSRPGRSIKPAPHALSLARSMLFFLLLVFSTQHTIVSLFKESAVTFSLADIDFLFPSPISRKLVLTYKRLLGYIGILFVSAFFTLIIAPTALGAFRIGLFPHLFIVWSVLAMLGITIGNITHTANLVFARRIEALKWANLTAKYVGVFAGVAFTAGIFWLGTSAAEKLPSMLRNGTMILESLNRTANMLWVKILFLPFTLAADVLISPYGKPAYPPVLAFFGLLALAVGSHYLLLSRREDIYEPSIATSQKMAQTMTAMRRGQTFSLEQQMQAQKSQGKKMRTFIPPFGRGAWALVWKNAVIAVRMLNPMTVFTAMVMIIFFYGFLHKFQSDGHPGFRNNGFWMFYILVIGTRISQSSTRQELRQGWIKGMPLKGWRVITAQSVFQILPVFVFLVIIMLIFEPLRTANRLAMVLLVVPSTAAAMAAAGNLGAVLYPKLDDIAHNFLSGIVSSILGLIPLSAAGLTLVMLPKIGLSDIVAGAVAASFNLACAVVMIALSGHLYDRVDLTMES